MVKDEVIGVVTDPGSSLTPEAARARGVLLLDPAQPLEPQYRRLLEHYDRLLSLHASPQLCPMHDAAAEAAEALGERVRVVDTRLGSAGLGAAALRAAEWVSHGADSAETLREVERLAREGRFYLLTHDLDRLVENRMLPALVGRFGRALGHWALIGLEQGRFQAPRPVREGKLLPTLVALLRRSFAARRLRVRAALGDLPPHLPADLKEALADGLHLEAGSLAPMDPVARMRVGDHALAVFAYPV